MKITCLSDALKVADHISDAIRRYVNEMDEVGILALPEPKFSRESALVRASSVSHTNCPKRTAAKKYGLIPDDIDEKTGYKFALAKYAAMFAKVAIDRMINFEDDFDEWIAKPEFPVEVPDLSGTIDMAIGNLSDHEAYPIEIKRTDSNFYDGLLPYAVWQTICYMEMLGSRYGFIVTLYDGKVGDFKVWVVADGDFHMGWRVYDGVTPCEFKSEDFPTGEDGRNYFSRGMWNDLISEGAEWARMYKPIGEAELDPQSGIVQAALDAPIIRNPFSKPCVQKYTPEKRYSLKGRGGKGGGPGDVMDGTGIVEGICPLYAHCHKYVLEASNIPANTALPETLEVREDLAGVLKFRLPKSSETERINVVDENDA